MLKVQRLGFIPLEQTKRAAGDYGSSRGSVRRGCRSLSARADIVGIDRLES